MTDKPKKNLVILDVTASAWGERNYSKGELIDLIKMHKKHLDEKISDFTETPAVVYLFTEGTFYSLSKILDLNKDKSDKSLIRDMSIGGFFRVDRKELQLIINDAKPTQIIIALDNNSLSSDFQEFVLANPSTEDVSYKFCVVNTHLD